MRISEGEVEVESFLFQNFSSGGEDWSMLYAGCESSIIIIESLVDIIL